MRCAKYAERRKWSHLLQVRGLYLHFYLRLRLHDQLRSCGISRPCVLLGAPNSTAVFGNQTTQSEVLLEALIKMGRGHGMGFVVVDWSSFTAHSTFPSPPTNMQETYKATSICFDARPAGIPRRVGQSASSAGNLCSPGSNRGGAPCSPCSPYRQAADGQGHPNPRGGCSRGSRSKIFSKKTETHPARNSNGCQFSLPNTHGHHPTPQASRTSHRRGRGSQRPWQRTCKGGVWVREISEQCSRQRSPGEIRGPRRPPGEVAHVCCGASGCRAGCAGAAQ